MFDTLTRPGLSTLHEQLYHELMAVMAMMFGPDWKPVLEVGGPTWLVLKAKAAEIHETMEAVFAEMRRRDQIGRCDCRTVADQGGEPRFWDCAVHGA